MKGFKPIWIVYICMLLLTVSIASASAPDPANTIAYYTFDENTGSTAGDSTPNRYNGTLVGSPAWVSAVINSGLDFTAGTDAYVEVTNAFSGIGTGDFSVNFWVYLTVSDTNNKFIMYTGREDDAFNDVFAISFQNNDLRVQTREGTTGGQLTTIATSPALDTWHMVTATRTGSTVETFFNSVSASSSNNAQNAVNVGGATNFIGQFGKIYNVSIPHLNSQAKIDELLIYGGILSQAQIDYLYASGSPGEAQQYPFGEDVPNFSLSAVNSFDNGSISNFSVELVSNETLVYNTSNGSIVTDLLSNDIRLWNITFTGDFFSRTYENYNVSSNLQGVLDLARINVDATDLFGQSITNFTYDVNGTGNYSSSETNPIKNGEWLFTFNKPGWYSKNETINITGSYPYTTSYTFTDIHDAWLNLSVVNAWTNASINNFTGWVTDNAGFNASFSAIGSSIEIGLMKDYNYTVFVEHPNYAIDEVYNYKNVSLNSTYQNASIGIYSKNSIVIFIKDEESGETVLDNITINVMSDSYEELFSTNTGSILIENLTDNIYSLKFMGSNYSDRFYSVTVAEASTQTLTAYLTPSTNTITFTVLEDGTSNVIDGARVSMYAMVDSEWVTIESKLTDITGKVQLLYTKNKRYKFVVSHDDYSSKTFELNPVLFDNYNIRLTKLTTFPDIPQIYTVSVDFMPKQFYKGENNITLFFNSPEGRFAEYGFTLIYPGGNYSFNGSNAIGESVTVTINITGAQFFDLVKLNYTYRVVGGEQRTHTYNLPILDVVTDLTIMDNLNNKYDLSVYEMLLIVTLTVLLVGGLTTITAGAQLGGTVILLLFGLFAFMGFVPYWTAALVLLAGFTYLASNKRV